MKGGGSAIKEPTQIGQRNAYSIFKSPCHRSLPRNHFPTSTHRKPQNVAAYSKFGNADAEPTTWQRLGALTAAAALTMQATFAPLAALADTTTASPPPPLIITPAIMNSLPPLPTEFPPLPPLKLPKFQKLTLKNGLKVVLLEDREAQLVRGTLVMRGGQRASPPDKVGLASIAAAVQRSGGSVAHPNTALDDELEELAAAIEGGAGSDAVSMGFSCLAEDAPRVLSLFSEVITTPAVPPAKIELLKTQLLNGLAHKNDNPSGIPTREAAKLIYGPNSPYAREPSIPQLSSITADDVTTWLSTWERPDSAVLGLVGDFNPKEMAKLVEQTLGEWKPPAGAPLSLPTPPLPPQESIQGKIYLIDRPGAPQASIAMAEPGIQLMDKDEVALDVLGGLLNSFGGKLFDELRSREGLAYSVSGGWATVPLDHPGLFIATAETAQPAALLRALRGALAEASTELPAASAVERAREESLNSFVFGFSSNVAQLRRTVAFELVGIPEDYPFTYRDRLVKVTPGDVQGAAMRHLHPFDMVTVVIGDAKTIKPKIEAALGTSVEILNLQDD